MALILKPKADKKIEVPGVDMELPELYVRIEFAGRADGKTLEIASSSYMNKSKYIEGKNCVTTVPMNTIKVEIGSDERQSLDVAIKYSQQFYESLGYEVIIEE